MTNTLIRAKGDNAVIDHAKLNAEQVDLLKRTICKGATDDELMMFVTVCNAKRLDPFSRQVHAVKRWDSSERREVMSIQTGIDGFRVIAERTGKYAGSDDPVYDSEDAEHPNRATATVYKLVGNTRIPFTATARWNEYVATKKDGTPNRFWATKPYLMLGKCAEALALRKAFPEDLSGLYTEDEMEHVNLQDLSDKERSERAQATIVRKKAEQEKAPEAPVGKIDEKQQQHLVARIVNELKIKPVKGLKLLQGLFGDGVKSSADLTMAQYTQLMMKLDAVKSGSMVFDDETLEFGGSGEETGGPDPEGEGQSTMF